MRGPRSAIRALRHDLLAIHLAPRGDDPWPGGTPVSTCTRCHRTIYNDQNGGWAT